MRIAIASGKGGTGKTLVAASLAKVWDGPVMAVDLDVEEPNLHLFLKPEFGRCEEARIEVPAVDEDRCTHCRACAELCQFKAISDLGRVLLTFPEMCHGCGGCLAVCPEKALMPSSRLLGEICFGQAQDLRFLMGRLRVGEAMSPPLIQAVKRASDGFLPGAGPCDIIFDAPPGVSCPAVNAVTGSDATVLVTEPTPFGFHDLKLAVEAFRPLGTPLGVVVNKAGLGDQDVFTFAAVEDLPVLAEIPYDRRIAEAYSKGKIVAEALPEMRYLFRGLAVRIQGLARPALKERRYA